MKVIIFGLSLLSSVTCVWAAEKAKTPHAKIIVRPGPPVKPTQPAKPVGNAKSDWTGKEKR